MHNIADMVLLGAVMINWSKMQPGEEDGGFEQLDRAYYGALTEGDKRFRHDGSC